MLGIFFFTLICDEEYKPSNFKGSFVFPRSGLPLVVGDTNTSDRCKNNILYKRLQFICLGKSPDLVQKCPQKDFCRGKLNDEPFPNTVLIQNVCERRR